MHKYREALRTISQVKTRSTRFRRRTKRAVKSLCSKRLISQRCEVGFQLAVFGFQRVGRKYQETSRGIPQHCAKWLRNHFAAKGWFRSRAKSAFSLELLHFNSESCTVWSIGLLTSWASKRHIVCINLTPGSAPKVSDMTIIKNASWQIFLSFPSLHSGFAYGKGLKSFGSSCFWALHCFAMDSKDLSSISDCFGDQITHKNTNTYTIWLEMIAKVLNILIGLKGNNYYSKEFKRVNYKLYNSTFWVVINYSS